MPDEIILSITHQPDAEGYIALLRQSDEPVDTEPGYLVIARQGGGYSLTFECLDGHYSFTVSLNELMEYAERL